MTLHEIDAWLRAHRHDKWVKSLAKSYPLHQVIGVSMADLRHLASLLGTNHELARECMKSSYYELQMIGSMIADIHQFNQMEWESFLIQAHSSSLIDQGWSDALLQLPQLDHLLLHWMHHHHPDLRYAGYAVFSAYCRLQPLEEIVIPFVLDTLNHIQQTIAQEPLVIQNAMNNGVVMAGLHVPEAVDVAMQVADAIGYILPLKAKNSCNIQSASDYLHRYLTQPRFSRVARLTMKK